MRSTSGTSALLLGSVLLVAVLSGCGGGGGSGSADPTSPATSALQGVWTGTLTDASGRVAIFETEHVATGTAIKGSARVVDDDGTIHHGVLSGTETTAGVELSVDFRDPLGIVDFRGTRNAKNLTLSYTQRAPGIGSGTGSLNQVQSVFNDLQGTYQVDWTANNQSGSFQFTVATPSGVNTIPFVQIPVVNGLMVFGGSCIGSTIAVGTKILAVGTGGSVNLVQMHFGEAPAGASGTVAGSQTIGAAVTQLQGSYKLTKVSS